MQPIPSHMALVLYKPKGRPTTFTWAVAQRLCDHIAEGGSLRGFCAIKGNPNKETVRRWLRSNQEFRAQYAQAREDQADHFIDEVIEIADDARNDWMERETHNGTITVVDMEALMRSKLRIDARKWIAGKMRPKVYGDKSETTHKLDVTETFLNIHKLVSGGKIGELVSP